MIGKLIPDKMWIVFGAGVLCLATASLAYAEDAKDDIEAELQRRIDAWGNYLRNESSISSGLTNNDYYRAIVELGPPAVPYLMERVGKGIWSLGGAIGMITRKRFTIEESSPDTPRDSRWYARMLAKWWPKARKETPLQFARRYSDWDELKAKGNKKETDQKLHDIHALGVAALPLICERIRSGDEHFVPIVASLTKQKVKSDATAAECLAWWEKNQEQWLLPFPNAQPVARARADRTGTAGQAIVLDGSASTDADGDALTYQWRQTAGPAVELSNAQAMQPTFTAPAVEQTTTLTFELIVDDAGDLTQAVPTPNSKSEPAQVTITIEPKWAPTTICKNSCRHKPGLARRPLAGIFHDVYDMCINTHCWRSTMRTNVVLDDGLMQTALELSGCKTKKKAIEEGLRLLIQLHRQKKIRKYRGKLSWTGDLDEMRTDR